MDKKKPIKQPLKKANSQVAKPKRDYTLIFLWVVIAVISIIRYRLIAIPFERDEGEYGYIGSLFLHGIAPFKDAYSMKLPGTSFMYAILILFFGHTSTGVHTGLLFVNAATMYFLFAAFKKIFNPFIGLATASIYGFMAVSFVFDGFAAHATHFICFYTSIALLFLADYMKSGKMLKVFLCGVMLGMAFLMKQQALFLILFAAVFLFVYLKTEKKQGFPVIARNIFMLGIGVFVPYIVVVLIILFSGQFSIFWLWTVEYASKYESLKNFASIMALFNSSFGPAWVICYYFWLLALAGAVVLYLSAYTRLQKSFTLIYLIASVCVVSSGFYFRQHYFVVLLPAMGLLSGIFIEFIIKKISPKISAGKALDISLLGLSAILLFTLYSNRAYYFSYSPKTICNMVYWGNPFNDAQEISKYIHDNSNDSDKIAVFGSEPEIYFYTNRTAATGFLYTYPLVENQPYNEVMQEQMISEIEKNKPAYILFCNTDYSWLSQAGTPKTIFKWGDKYTHEHYTPVGFADFIFKKGWRIYWGNDIINRVEQPESSLIILKRNP